MMFQIKPPEKSISVNSGPDTEAKKINNIS